MTNEEFEVSRNYCLPLTPVHLTNKVT